MTTRTIDETDRQLLERFVAKADELAFAKLVKRHGPLVLGVCRQILREEHDAEDVFQEVFARTYERLDALRDDSAVRPWLDSKGAQLLVDLGNLWWFTIASATCG